MRSFGWIRSATQSPGSASCGPLFFGGGMGMKYELIRRASTISFVIPSSANRKWRVGSTKGELRTGFSMTAATLGKANETDRRPLR